MASNRTPAHARNTYARYYSDEVRSLMLKQKRWEIDAFARDRSLDPDMLASIAQTVLRLGRIPDLERYGLFNDDAQAVGHFLADAILNVESVDDDDNLTEGLEEDAKFTSSLARKLGRLKKDVGAAMVRQGYKGQGKYKADRQVFIRWPGEPLTPGTLLVIWLGRTAANLGGGGNNDRDNPISYPPPRVMFDGRSVDAVYADILKIIKKWRSTLKEDNAQPSVQDIVNEFNRMVFNGQDRVPQKMIDKDSLPVGQAGPSQSRLKTPTGCRLNVDMETINGNPFRMQ